MMLAKQSSAAFEYAEWRAMLRAAFTQDIPIQPSWKQNFRSFLRDMGVRPRGCHLQRWDENGVFSNGNCYWGAS